MTSALVPTTENGPIGPFWSVYGLFLSFFRVPQLQLSHHGLMKNEARITESTSDYLGYNSPVAGDTTGGAMVGQRIQKFNRPIQINTDCSTLTVLLWPPPLGCIPSDNPLGTSECFDGCLGSLICDGWRDACQELLAKV